MKPTIEFILGSCFLKLKQTPNNNLKTNILLLLFEFGGISFVHVFKIEHFSALLGAYIHKYIHIHRHT